MKNFIRLLSAENIQLIGWKNDEDMSILLTLRTWRTSYNRHWQEIYEVHCVIYFDFLITLLYHLTKYRIKYERIFQDYGITARYSVIPMSTGVSRFFRTKMNNNNFFLKIFMNTKHLIVFDLGILANHHLYHYFHSVSYEWIVLLWVAATGT